MLDALLERSGRACHRAPPVASAQASTSHARAACWASSSATAQKAGFTPVLAAQVPQPARAAACAQHEFRVKTRRVSGRADRGADEHAVGGPTNMSASLPRARATPGPWGGRRTCPPRCRGRAPPRWRKLNSSVRHAHNTSSASCRDRRDTARWDEHASVGRSAMSGPRISHVFRRNRSSSSGRYSLGWRA